jgi:leader peptidase (prepilin peptidase)/N-methyltransferase
VPSAVMSDPLPEYFAVGVAVVFGLLVGSFANVCIYRIPLEQSIVFPASRCPRCSSAIAPWQNLPVLSWLLLRGKCASCRAPISMRYPLVEGLHGAGFGAVVYTFGVNPFTPVLCALFSSLVILALIDWDHQILPDVITLPGIVLGVLTTFVPGALISWKESILSAVFGFVAFFIVARSYSRFRGIEGLGMGDWKLAAMMGAFLGGRALLLIVFLGSLSGMTFGLVQALRQRRRLALESAAQPVEVVDPVVATEETVPTGESDSDDEGDGSIARFRLPFGTFLAASAIFVMFRGDAVLFWYSSFFPS